MRIIKRPKKNTYSNLIPKEKFIQNENIGSYLKYKSLCINMKPKIISIPNQVKKYMKNSSSEKNTNFIDEENSNYYL